MNRTRDFFTALISQAERLNNDQIIDIFYKIGVDGNIVLLKNDGLRNNDTFSVVILSADGKFESIRFDGDDLSAIIKRALDKYIEFL